MSFLGGGANLGTAYGAIVIGTDSALRNINILGGALRASAANAMGSGRDFFTAGLLMSTAGAGMQLAFRDVVDVGMQFDKQMSAVVATLGKEAIPLMEELRQKAKDIGRDTVFSANEAGQAMEELAKAGVPAEGILNGVADATVNLAAATDTDLPTAAAAMANAMNAFELGPEDAAHAADILTAALNESSSNIHDITAGMRTLGPVAHNMGIDFDDASAAIASFTNFGLRGADAGVSLARGITMASKPTDEARLKMDELGITVFDTQGKFIGFGPLFDMLHDKMGNMSDESREAALSMIFGAEAADVMSIAVAQGADEYERILAEEQKVGTASEEAGIRMDNLAGDVEKLHGSLETARIEGFERINPVMRKTVQALDFLVDAFSRAPDPIMDVVVAVLSLGGALLSAAGANLLFGNRIKAGIAALRAYQFAFLGLRGSVLGFAALAAIFGLAWSTNLFGVRDKITGFRDDIVDAFDQIVAAWEPVSRILDYIFNTGVKNEKGNDFLSKSGLDLFLDDLVGAGVSVKHAQEIVQFFKDIHRPLRITERLFRNARLGIGDFFDIISGGDSSMFKFRQRMRQVFGKEAGDEIAGATFKMRQSIRKLKGELKKQFGFDVGQFFTLEGALDFVSKGFNRLVDVIQDRFLPWIGPKIAKGIEIAAQGLSFVAGHLDTVKSAFETVVGVGQRLLGAVFTPLALLLQGQLGEAFDSVVTSLGTLVDTAAGFAVTVGVQILDWVIGLGEQVPELKDAISDKIDEWWPEVKGEAKKLYGYAVELWGWLVTQGETLVNAVIKKIDEWWPVVASQGKRLVGYAVQLWDWLVTQGETLANAVISKINQWWPVVAAQRQRLAGYAVELWDWLVTQGSTLANAVVEKVNEWWGQTANQRKQLTGYAVELYGWVATQGETLANAIATRVNEWWGGIVGQVQNLSGYAVQLYGWAVTQGETLANAIALKIDEWWPPIAEGAKELAGYTIKLGGWVLQELVDGQLGTDAHDWIDEKLNAAGIKINLTDWHLTVKSPGTPNIDIDIGSMQQDLDNAMETALVAPEGTTDAARKSGEKMGERAVNALIDGIVSVFGGGGGGEGGGGGGGILGKFDFPTKGEARFLTLPAFIFGFITEGFQTAFSRVGEMLGELTPDDVEAWLAEPDLIGRIVDKWFNTLFVDPLKNYVVDPSNNFLDAVSTKMQEALFGKEEKLNVSPTGGSDPTQVVGGLGNLLDGIFNAIPGKISEFFTPGANPFDGIGEGVYGWITDALSKVESKLDSISGWARKLLSGDWAGAIKDFFKEHGGDTGDTGDDATQTDDTAHQDIDEEAQDIIEEEGNKKRALPMKFKVLPEVANKTDISGLLSQAINEAVSGGVSAAERAGRGTSPSERAGQSDANTVKVAINVAVEIGNEDEIQGQIAALISGVTSGIGGGAPHRNPDGSTSGGGDASIQFTATFDADTTGVARGLAIAMQAGQSWDSQVFTATFNVDTSGISLGSGVNAALGGAGTGLEQLVQQGPDLQRLAQPIQGIGQAAVGMAQDFSTSMPVVDSALNATANTIGVGFVGAVGQGVAATQQAGAGMTQAFNGIGISAAQSAQVAGTGFATGIGAGMVQAQGQAQSGAENIGAAFTTLAVIAGIQGFAGGNQFAAGIGAGMGIAAGMAASGVATIQGIMAGISAGAFSAGQAAGAALGDGLVSGISSRTGAVSAAASALSAAASSAIQQANAIKSPSKLYAYFGQMMGQGLADGMMAMVTPIEQSADALSNAAMPEVDQNLLHSLSEPNIATGPNVTVYQTNVHGGINVDQAQDLVRWGRFTSNLSSSHATTMAGT
jgi:TP901 family phage tail tape measure protein